jgi:3-oxoacyl-[acyl-carrier protein] reductase
MGKSKAPRVIVVTGAGRGIGSVVVERFVALGDAVVIADLVAERADATAQKLKALGGRALAIGCDVTSAKSVEDMTRQTLDEFGRIDVLANLASGFIKTSRPTHDTPEAEWDIVVDSNLKGTFLCAKTVLPSMLKQGGGRIINFSSNAGRTSSPVQGCAYTAAKAGVIGFTRHLAKEYAKHKILVNTVAPGPVKGDRNDDLVAPGGEELLIAQIPLGRMAQPGDIAGVVVFLASEEASFITGATIDVNGGLVMA